jgi:carbon-monoxide dehydrogenase large subunit
VVAGDTGAISLGMGAFASRQTVMGGSAVHVAASVVRDKVRKAAAEILEVDADDLELRDGRVEVKGVPRHGLGFGEIAIAMAGVPGYRLPGDLPPGLEHSHNHLGNSLTYAGAFMAVELEVDAETGRVALRKIVVVNDAGVAINPASVRGQVTGSVVHTLGNALFERMVYDDAAQPQTTTFAEYLMPTATELPPIEVILVEYPSRTNPLGVKGAGETACIPVPAAIVCAVENALAPFGVRLSEFPLSPAGILRSIEDARRAGQGRQE